MRETGWEEEEEEEGGSKKKMLTATPEDLFKWQVFRTPFLSSPLSTLSLSLPQHEGKWHFEMKTNLCHERCIPLSLRGFAHWENKMEKQASRRAEPPADTSPMHLRWMAHNSSPQRCSFSFANAPHAQALPFFFLIINSFSFFLAQSGRRSRCAAKIFSAPPFPPRGSSSWTSAFCADSRLLLLITTACWYNLQ